MTYSNIVSLKQAYLKGENITSLIKELDATNLNSAEAIELAYDLQAGSYVEAVLKTPHKFKPYYDQLREILVKYIAEDDCILDAGTGEMTTLGGVFSNIDINFARLYCFDISLSRLLVGRKHISKTCAIDFAAKLFPFAADISTIPLEDNAVDLTWTSHALEPNHGREFDLLRELFRVTKRKCVLFEPSYENNTIEGMNRMEKLGYVRDLPNQINKAGGNLVDVVKINAADQLSPLNPTYAYIVSMQKSACGSVLASNTCFQCPTTYEPLDCSRQDSLFSSRGLIAYPVISGIPLLRRGLAIPACHTELLTEI
jgi:hypothetical protein